MDESDGCAGPTELPYIIMRSRHSSDEWTIRSLYAEVIDDLLACVHQLGIEGVGMEDYSVEELQIPASLSFHSTALTTHTLTNIPVVPYKSPEILLLALALSGTKNPPGTGGTCATAAKLIL